MHICFLKFKFTTRIFSLLRQEQVVWCCFIYAYACNTFCGVLCSNWVENNKACDQLPLMAGFISFHH
ncbi:hypothetical protein BTV54_09640 [Pasteurella multocida subsp. multocida]|nr:hypothetical protein [Pasteurella multocida]OPC85887.1 hypothetical protein BTV54_09640 [Pasteurella multocida subsp. multocida]